VKLLLDTHLLLWAAAQTARLSSAARAMLADESAQLLFSAASLWEIAIKRGLERDDFRVEAGALRRSLLENGYGEIAINGAHAVAVETLPHIHRDPFDRILIAQAIVEGVTLVTSDPVVAKYPGAIRRV
jgi:PIN domain nuclease of toxin-antitoxin system